MLRTITKKSKQGNIEDCNVGCWSLLNKIDNTFYDKIDAASSIINDNKKLKCTKIKKQKHMKQN